MSWEIFFGLGALALLAGLVWGMTAYKTRNRRNDPLTEAATKEEYDDPERYGRKEDRLREQVRR